MKLATLRNGRPDGALVVVSRDLKHCLSAAEVVPTMQAALDDWQAVEPGLRGLAEKVETDAARRPFDPSEALAPLPRAYQWADGSAYVNHVELVRKARGAACPTRSGPIR